MLDPDRDQSSGSFVRKMATFYGSLFVALGVHLPFLPIWFAARHLDPQMIGMVLAAPMVLRLVAIPAATRVADRSGDLRIVMLVAIVVALVGFIALGLSGSVVLIALLYAIAATAFMLLFVLSDIYALRGLAPYRRPYGPVRLWGSAAFIAANLGAGYLLDVIADRDLIWLVVAAVAVCGVTGWALPPAGTRPATARAPSSGFALLRNRAFAAVLAAASLIQASHALYYGFSTLDWQAAGFSGRAIGLLWGLGVLAEIVLFALSPRLKLGPSLLILIGGLGALTRWSLMSIGPPLALLPFLQCLHALSFGATHLGTLAFIARAAPAGLAARAQGYFAVCSGLAMAASTGLCGVLYARIGASAYAVMALLAGAGVLAALAMRRFGEPRAANEF